MTSFCLSLPPRPPSQIPTSPLHAVEAETFPGASGERTAAAGSVEPGSSSAARGLGAACRRRAGACPRQPGEATGKAAFTSVSQAADAALKTRFQKENYTQTCPERTGVTAWVLVSFFFFFFFLPANWFCSVSSILSGFLHFWVQTIADLGREVMWSTTFLTALWFFLGGFGGFFPPKRVCTNIIVTLF